MIARGLSSGNICLGCRLRLLRQVTRPNLSQSINRTRSPAVYGPRTQRWFASEAPTRSDEPDSNRDNDDWEALEKASDSEKQAYSDFLKQGDSLPEVNDFPDVKSKSHSRPPREMENNFRPVRHLDLRKRHLSGKKILTETSESLGSDMLGKPAYAIVMRDGGAYRKKKRPVNIDDPNKSKKQLEKLDIEALLGSQLEPPTDAEVRGNIDELRPPKTELFLKEKDFRRIQLELEEGFLREQLINYIETFEPEDSVKDSSEQTTPSHQTEEAQLRSQFQWISEVVPWLPLNPSGEPSGYESNRLLHGYLLPDASPKARAALRIMRDCWGLQIEEIAHGPGEMRVTLESQQFMPLVRGTQRFLHSISNKYLEEGETIEAATGAREIRIVAPRFKCQTIMTELDSLVQKIRTHTFPISHVTSDSSEVTDELLEQVGRVTNTHVRQTETRNRLQVAWIQVSSHDNMEVENLSHVVFRFLHTALRHDPAVQILHVKEAEEALASGGGRFVVDHSNKEKWAWKDRLATWARFVAPVSALHSEIEAADATITEFTLPKLSLDIEKPQVVQAQPISVSAEDIEQSINSSSPLPENITIQEETQFPLQPVRWSPSLTTTTTAVFGHFLSPSVKNAEPRGSALPDIITKSFKLRPSNFSPVVPHPMSLADLSLSPTDTTGNDMYSINSTILVRLLHNPESAIRALPLVAPPLELRLSLSEPHHEQDPEITGVDSLRAITTTQHNDILFPKNPVDLRITQTRSASLQGSARAVEDWQPIADFLARSRLDFSAGKLEMAAQQRFQVPLDLFSEAPVTKQSERNRRRRAEQQSEAETEAESSTSLRSTLYEFAGLELHRSVTVPYPEDARFSMTYTSVEAGQGGGRRAELSLRPVPASLPLASQYSAPRPEEQANLHDDYVRACYKFAQTVKHWSGVSTI